MKTFNIGDKVKIVELHKQDSFYNKRDKFIGTTGFVTDVYGSGIGANPSEGFIGIRIDDYFYHGVKLQLVEAAK